jgi:nucleoside-diphosphate-sugar epimerase/glycosyltransferase involved in cell wall biosynthesis
MIVRLMPSRSPENLSLEAKIKRLQGPMLVLGASGFVGANLLRTILRYRDDVYGTASRLPAWRLEDLRSENIIVTDLLVDSNLDAMLDTVKPRTVFDCVGYGGYSFETDAGLIYETNFNLIGRLLGRLERRTIACYLHAGSSSEYGDNAAAPREDSPTFPNSNYAVSKVATANLIHFFGKKRKLPCANLRLYSVYGPLEDSSRLVPNLIRSGLAGEYPELVNPLVSRDFIYVDDVTDAFFTIAGDIEDRDFGESFNVGTGSKTTIADLAIIARDAFGLQHEPRYTMPNREWDLADWYSNASKLSERFGWQAQTSVRDGLALTIEWYRNIVDKERYWQSSKKFGLDTKHSVSAVIACYKDEQAIPIMYERLKDAFTKLNIDYEIIFVNDCSPDTSEEVIRAISRNDRRVLGISHSRNFGSQAAFRSGMEVASKNSCVLFDGDLQDPPELVQQFVANWREGYDVVYGRRVKREASLFMQAAYKLFYRTFDYFSYLKIPHDAGDCSLLDRRVVEAILRFPERDLFLRGVRAYAGFRQIGVDYVRPERMFGVTTNSFWKNLGWAKKGILSFSYVPLTMLSVSALFLFVISLVLMLAEVVLKIVSPNLAPKGFATVLLLILFFGSLNLLAIGVVGEYLAKIFEEVKQRPHFIRRCVIRDGEVRVTSQEQKRRQ